LEAERGRQALRGGITKKKKVDDRQRGSCRNDWCSFGKAESVVGGGGKKLKMRKTSETTEVTPKVR